MCVHAPQRFCISKLRPTRGRAEKRGAERGVGILILGYRFERRRKRQPRSRRPDAIVLAQRFTIGVADERGAVVDLGRAALGGLEILRLSEEGEPAAEGFLIGGIVEAQEVWRAIAGRVFQVWGESDG